MRAGSAGETWFLNGVKAARVNFAAEKLTVDYDPERSIIHVHALDTDDPDAMVKEIKQRYETPLKEALGC